VPQFTPPVLTGRDSHTPRLLASSRGAERALYSRVTPVPSAQSVLKAPDGTYRTVTCPSQDEIAAAAVYYQGGRTYEVSDAEAAALTDAGYTVSP
jgi:hypothetical protein